MKKKDYSPLKICFIIGLINSIILFIIYLIVSNISCEKSFFCSFECNNIYYFDNLKCLLDDSAKIIIFIILIILYGTRKALYNIIINSYTFLHTIYFYLYEDLLISIKLMVPNNPNLSIINSVVNLIIQIIAILIFFEVIELHFCGLDINLKKYIIERAIKDSYENENLDKNKKEEKIIEIAENYYITYNNDEEEKKD